MTIDMYSYIWCVYYIHIYIYIYTYTHTHIYILHIHMGFLMIMAVDSAVDQSLLFCTAQSPEKSMYFPV